MGILYNMVFLDIIYLLYKILCLGLIIRNTVDEMTTVKTITFLNICVEIAVATFYSKSNIDSLTNANIISTEEVPSSIACIQKCNFKIAVAVYERNWCYCFQQQIENKDTQISG